MTSVTVWFAGGGTGGHLYPGLAIARALVAREARVAPFFIGAHRGIEREILPTTEFPFRLLDLHPLYRQAPWRNGRTLLGAVRAWRALRRRSLMMTSWILMILRLIPRRKVRLLLSLFPRGRRKSFQ